MLAGRAAIVSLVGQACSKASGKLHKPVIAIREQREMRLFVQRVRTDSQRIDYELVVRKEAAHSIVSVTDSRGEENGSRYIPLGGHTQELHDAAHPNNALHPGTLTTS